MPEGYHHLTYSEKCQICALKKKSRLATAHKVEVTASFSAITDLRPVFFSKSFGWLWLCLRNSAQRAAFAHSYEEYILLVAENGNLDGAKAPGLNDRKYPLYF